MIDEVDRKPIPPGTHQPRSRHQNTDVPTQDEQSSLERTAQQAWNMVAVQGSDTQSEGRFTLSAQPFNSREAKDVTRKASDSFV